MKNSKLFVLGLALLFHVSAFSQKEIRIPLGDDSTYLRFTGAIQVWTRYTQNNPGSGLTFGQQFFAQNETFDIGIRRARFQAYGPIAKRVVFYSQFGMNNFTQLTPRKTGAFFHDLTAEYVFVPGALNIGAGLTGWSGLGRYASPSIASTLMYDAPLFEQSTNDVTDQFLRKLSIYAKGKLGRLDYRVALSKPMPVQLGIASADTVLFSGLTNVAVFSPFPAKAQSQAYFNWQFLDQESNLTPYTQGSYLGKKRVFNIGAGIIHQPQAMQYLNSERKREFAPLSLWSVDVFLDYALNKEKQNAVTVYGGFFRFDFGPNYLRPFGVMNTVNSSNNASVRRYSGFGNAFPMYGTGNILYLQSGYLFKKDLLGDLGSLQPNADIMIADYEALRGLSVVWNVGLNWLIRGNNGKLSLNYQSRPVFESDPATVFGGRERQNGRLGMLVLQWQVFI